MLTDRQKAEMGTWTEPVPVSPLPSFRLRCSRCGTSGTSDDGRPWCADTTGEPFASYYCDGACADFAQSDRRRRASDNARTCSWNLRHPDSREPLVDEYTGAPV